MSKEVAAKQEKGDQQLIQIDPGVTVPGFGTQKSFELAMRGAKVLSSSSLVPKEYQGDMANCIIALNMASRMGADPLMVMQNLYIVHGRPGWSSQFLISTFNTSGRFSALRYDWNGEEGTDSWGCRAWAIEKSTGERLEGSLVTIGMAKKEGWYGKNGSKWQTMSQQMLMYRAASFFIRTYAPELAMGMHTVEEVQDMGEVRLSPEKAIQQFANKEIIDVGPEQEDLADKMIPQEDVAPVAEEKQNAESELPLKPGEEQMSMDAGPGF